MGLCDLSHLVSANLSNVCLVRGARECREHKDARDKRSSSDFQLPHFR